MTLSGRLVRIAIAAVLVALAATAVTFSLRSDSASGVFPIENSYAFDVSDKEQLAGYADDIYIGSVSAIRSIDEEAATTQYEVQIDEVLKGRLDGTVIVSQSGYRKGDATYVSEDQPLLHIGAVYLLVTNPDVREKGQHTLVAGPASAVSASENRGEIIREYARAIRNQYYPPGVAPRN